MRNRYRSGVCAVVCLVVAFSSCTLALSPTDETSIIPKDEINGWVISQDITARGTSEVNEYIAQKVEYLSNGKSYHVLARGDFLSIYDRINDPFFGLLDELQVLTTEQQAYIASLKNRTEDPSVVGQRHIDVIVTPVQSASRSARSSVDVSFDILGEAGTVIQFSQGWCFGNTYAYTTVFNEPFGGRVDCKLERSEMWQSPWVLEATANDMVFNYNISKILVGFRFGWCRWRVTWSFDTRTCMRGEIDW